MFKNFLKLWKGKDFLVKVLDEFKNMLNDAHEMFDSVCRKLVHNEDAAGLKEKIYGLDQKINALQKDIRKRIVEHLTLQPSVDVPACLIFMSVVKDAERLGDYCKNLFEVTQLLDKPIDKEKYQSLFGNVDREISAFFTETRDAFIESDEAKANHAWNTKGSTTKRCDEIIEKLAKSDYAINEAVCFTLVARYFKRIAAHLGNIATSVVLPISDLDYFDEKRDD
ncbi:MAG: hypothetical protein HQ593_06630 [Candidatus Omnitrophica bacterium]|nr:hypothetical protein [Candidatus Omnitrophota bacterium]